MIGWWNSCICWSAYWTVGIGSKAIVPTGLVEKENSRDPFYYGMIAAALGFQSVLFVVMLRKNWNGLKLIYRDEDKMEGFYEELEKMSVKQP